jgi:hypothetical protein
MVAYVGRSAAKNAKFADRYSIDLDSQPARMVSVVGKQDTQMYISTHKSSELAGPIAAVLSALP